MSALSAPVSAQAVFTNTFTRSDGFLCLGLRRGSDIFKGGEGDDVIAYTFAYESGPSDASG